MGASGAGIRAFGFSQGAIFYHLAAPAAAMPGRGSNGRTAERPGRRAARLLL